MKDALRRVARRLTGSGIGPLATFVSVRLLAASGRHAAVQRGSRPGQAFSGPRSRGEDSCGEPLPRQQRLGVSKGWRPRIGPAPACPSRLPSHRRGIPAGTPPLPVAGRWWCLRAQAPFAVATPSLWHRGDDARGQGRPRPCPASVGRRTQAPPATCRSGVWTHGRHRKTATGRKPSTSMREAR